MSTWSHLRMDTIGDLFHPVTGNPLTRVQMVCNIRRADPSLHRMKVYAYATILGKYITITRIPQWLLDSLTLTRPAYENGEIVHFTSDVDGEHYGHLEDHMLYERREDSSGFSVPLPDPYDVSSWDLEDPVDGVQKVALWGNKGRHFRPIQGPMSSCYPQDGWWKSPLLPDPFLLSELSIRRMTLMYTKDSSPPNCEENWHARVYHLLPTGKLPWRDIWSSLGSFLLSRRAENTWWKFLHRSLFVMSRQSAESTLCRLCGNKDESHLHLPFCTSTRPVRRLVKRMIRALGHDDSLIHTNPLLSLGFNLDSQGKVWKDKVVLTIMRLYWRVIYRHMTKLRMEGTPFHSPAVERDLCRAFMSCILSYQSARRSHYLKHLYTSKTEILPEAAAKQVESLGVLDVLTGVLTVHKPIVNILSEYDQVWVDFNDV